jgi:cytochrome P450
LAAGHGTTSNALTWTLFLLNQHPRICADLLDELQGTLHGNAPTIEQLSRLLLLEGVINKSLRLLPPTPIGIRIAAAACELGGYALPRGANVIYLERQSGL